MHASRGTGPDPAPDRHPGLYSLCPSCGVRIDPETETCPACGAAVDVAAEMHYTPPHTAVAKIVSWILLAAIAATLVAVVVALLTT